MLTIGLTGSLATGKSTVAVIMRDLGARIIDADQVSHQLMARGKGCYLKIVKQFGKEILESGEISRKKLAHIVFNNKKNLAMLEGIIHPQVEKEIKRRIKFYYAENSKSIVVLDVPLLFESGMNRLVDVVVVVKANAKLQVSRIVKRLNISTTEARRRIKSQMPIQEKIRLADFVIDNRESLKNTKKQVEKIWQILQQEKK